MAMAAQIPLIHKSLAANFHSKHSSQCTRTTSRRMTLHCRMITRRATTSSLAVLITEAISREQTASALDFRITAPDQTIEQAESGIKGHAQSLVQVKGLLEEESWKAAQKALRKSSAELKQDIYTIIQSKPGSERPELRKLYSKLFNNVTRLDYAALDENIPLVWECYDNVVLALNDILSRL